MGGPALMRRSPPEDKPMLIGKLHSFAICHRPVRQRKPLETKLALPQSHRAVIHNAVNQVRRRAGAVPLASLEETLLAYPPPGASEIVASYH